MSELNIEDQWLLLSSRERSIIDTWIRKHIQIEHSNNTTNSIQNLHLFNAFPDYKKEMLSGKTQKKKYHLNAHAVIRNFI